MSPEYDQYLDRKIAEVPRPMVQACVDFLRGYIPDEEKRQIRILFSVNGASWMTLNRYHLDRGMEIRNALRSAGFRDHMLPPGQTWDDYYAQMIELSLGLRELDGIK